MTKYFDITDQVFGNLTAIESIKKNGKRFWRFRCVCGKIVEHLTSRVASGHIKSCGCTLKNKFYGEQSLAYTIFVRNYADGDLTFDKFYELIFNDCFYCGSPPANVHSRKNFKSKKIIYSIKYNGLDRVDSNLPHNSNNVVPCCIICNKLKSNRHINDFLKQIEDIYNYRVGK